MDLYFHYFIEKRFHLYLLTKNCGYIQFSNFEYVVCLKLEYSEIFTRNHFEKIFDKETDAIQYFDELLENNKKKNNNQIFDSIINDVYSEITYLSEHTKYLESK